MCYHTSNDGKSSDIFPTLNAFCFCVSLRTASLVIGWYYLVVGLMGIIPMLPKQYEFVTSISTTGNTGEMITRLLIVEYYFLLLLLTIACGFLINGIRKKIPKHVRPFIFYGSIFILHEIFVILLLMFTPLRHDAESFIKTFSETYAMVLTNPYLKSFDLFLGGYLLLTVHSYYKELKREVGQNNGGAIV